jgi:hypothetical protein
MTVEDAEGWCDAWKLEAANRDVSRNDRDYWAVGLALESRRSEPRAGRAGR